MPLLKSTYQDIQERLWRFENPTRRALSSRFPFLKKPIIQTRVVLRKMQNAMDKRIQKKKLDFFLPAVVARHQSVLRRKLGDSDMRLQEQKITNLQEAAQRLNGCVIEPGRVFSLWEMIGKPDPKFGYTTGMLLANGRVVEGMGGGLCQLSNFLYWIFLHAPVETVERYHHSMDVFPDSGRVLPFGGGATILYNFVDLKLKNVSKESLQIKIWLTATHLKGQILASAPIPEKFHIFEKEHCFVKHKNQYFRYNQILRECRVQGELQYTQPITTNFAPVLYTITPEYLERHSFEVVESGELAEE